MSTQIVTKKRELPGSDPELKDKPRPPLKLCSGAVGKTLRIVKNALSDDVGKVIQAIDLFELSGEDGRCIEEYVTNGFGNMFSGQLKVTMAFMSRKMKVKGNVALEIELEKLINQITPHCEEKEK
ncbi:Hydroxysteroid dehydrogenase-like protein 2, partial [Galemys pyrenaicus]